MKSPSLHAVIPVKSFASAKQRLSPLLNAHERASLACAMFEDVLDVIVGSPCLAGTLVVTDDVQAAAIANARGARVLTGPAEAGLRPAIRHAARALCDAGHLGMLMIPADLPMVKPTDLELITLAHGTAPAVTLVAASSDGGTNALVCSPPDAIDACFGHESFRLHRQAAQEAGLVAKVLMLPRLERDIDRPEDLFAFLQQPSGPRTHAYLAVSGIAERLYELNTQARPAHPKPIHCTAFISDESAAIQIKG